ncbi:MAG: ExbD/TolR family protein [Phycisphaerales bacterium]
MRFRPPAKPHLVRLELTAMIDVIFLLIIFFMTTAQFVQRARAEVELPEEQGEEQARLENPPLVINILSEGAAPFQIGETRLTMTGALALIDREIRRLQEDGKNAEDLELTIRADRRGLSRVLNELGAELRDRGVTRWRLATQPTG